MLLAWGGWGQIYFCQALVLAVSHVHRVNETSVFVCMCSLEVACNAWQCGPSGGLSEREKFFV